MQSLQRTQFRLLRDIFLIALIVIGLIILLVVYLGSMSRREYSEKIIVQASENVTSAFENRLRPFDKSLNILKEWGVSELSTTDKANSFNTELLNASLIPILENIGLQSHFRLATSLGTEYLLYRKNQYWLTRSANISEWGTKRKWQRWQLSGELEEEWWSENEHDPRTEPWYQKGLAAVSQQPTWTEPYISSFSQQSVLTGVIRWTRQNAKEILYVAAFDIPLAEIHQAISQLKATDHGQSFIVTNDGRVFSPISGDRKQQAGTGLEQIFIPSSQVENPVIAKAVEDWRMRADAPTRPYFFRVDGKGWWAGFKPLGTKQQSLFWIGIAVPEVDFVGDVSTRRTLFFIILALVIFAGGFFTLLIVRQHSKRLRQAQQIIFDAAKLSEQLPIMIEQGESYKQEFKSTMRHNLRDDKPDKGIELAWLKSVVGFLNSEGGTLFIGIADDGTILGLEADNFANEDKCRLHFKNLLNQHIGLEYSRYIHFELISHGEKQIAVVQCEKSQSPVFLKNRNDEEFYIRSGPSSSKLTGSKLLKYLEHSKSVSH